MMKKISPYLYVPFGMVATTGLLFVVYFMALPKEWIPVAKYPSTSYVLAKTTCCDCHYYILNVHSCESHKIYYSPYPFAKGLVAQQTCDQLWGTIEEWSLVQIPFKFRRLIAKKASPCLLAQDADSGLWQLVDREEGSPVDDKWYRAVDVALNDSLFDTPYFIVSPDSVNFVLVNVYSGASSPIDCSNQSSAENQPIE